MQLSLPISVSLLLLACQTGRALPAPAADFFNSGAQFYISNNLPQALAPVEEGLKLYPDDVKLKKLYELLKQQQQSQQNQQQQNQQNQSQQSKDNQKSQQQQNQQQQKQNSQAQQKQNPAEQQKAQQQKQQEKQGEQGQPVAAGQMTPEEAKRLLDGQKDGEQVLQWKPQGKPESLNRPIKDW
jgi:Ca-activated chloride channel family protein